MTKRFTEAASMASTMARQPAAWISTARTSAQSLSLLSLRNLLATAQHTLTVCGFSALAMIAVLMARPDLAKQISKSLSGESSAAAAESAPAAPPLTALLAPKATATPAAATGPTAQGATAPLTADEKAMLGTRRQQQWVTSWLSKRYRVAGDAADMLVSTAYLTARDIKLDPLLILAVMSIESGLNPFAESPMGAQGLMQVMAKVHHDKFEEMGGMQAALNPVANIRVGSLILKDYVTRGGSVEAGLKTYVGAGAFENDSGYGSRVLAEYHRLKQVSAGKNVPTSAPIIAAAPVEKSVVVKHDEIAGL
jgi:soluble lytic murein transglycosylase-like protein